MARIVCAWMPVILLSIGSVCVFGNSDFLRKSWWKSGEGRWTWKILAMVIHHARDCRFSTSPVVPAACKRVHNGPPLPSLHLHNLISSVICNDCE
jgi:hypothetical protein